jgi:hypothetical protein
MFPAAYLSQKLTEPLPTKDGFVLGTIGEAANYILALPHERAEQSLATCRPAPARAG